MTTATLPPDVWIVWQLARHVRDGETVASGEDSALAASAVLLAKHTHAPHATVFCFHLPAWFPFQEGNGEFFDLAARGRLDLFFLSGAQIDRRGNVNLHAIGHPWEAPPKVRFPGARGSAVLTATAGRVVLYKTEHSARGLVPAVDVRSAVGRYAEGVRRGRGVVALHTPLAGFTMSEAGELELASLVPGHTVEEVRAATGWPLRVREPFETVPPPPPEALDVLTTVVAREIRPAYPLMARTLRTLRRRLARF